MMFDSVGLEVLGRVECMALLADRGLGRIVYTDDAMPAVQPVTYCVAHGMLVIRTPSSRLVTAARNTIVAFEVDSFAGDLQTGWSVSVLGRARQITDRAELEQLETINDVGRTDQAEHYLRIASECVTGRRISGVTTGASRSASP